MSPRGFASIDTSISDYTLPDLIRHAGPGSTGRGRPCRPHDGGRSLTPPDAERSFGRCFSRSAPNVDHSPSSRPRILPHLALHVDSRHDRGVLRPHQGIGPPVRPDGPAPRARSMA